MPSATLERIELVVPAIFISYRHSDAADEAGDQRAFAVRLEHKIVVAQGLVFLEAHRTYEHTSGAGRRFAPG